MRCQSGRHRPASQKSLALGQSLLWVHHGIFSLTSSKQGCFIDNIGEVCTDKPGSLGGDHTQVYGGGECDLFRVQPKDLLAAFKIGPVY